MLISEFRILASVRLPAQVSDPPATPLPAALILFGSGIGVSAHCAAARKHRHGPGVIRDIS